MELSINLNNISISHDTRILLFKDEMVIGNIYSNGKWIKIPQCYFNYLISFLGVDNGFEELIKSTKSENEKNFYIDLLYKLREIGALGRQDYQDYKEEIDIKDISLELTTSCNLKCKHCSNESGDKKIDNMTIENITKVVHWANEHNVKSLTLTGGEIFCLKDIDEKIELIRNQFTGRIEVITNATLIDEEKVKLLKKNIDKIDISLDGYDEESVNRIRGKNVYERVMRSVALLQENGYSNISLSMVLTSDNRQNIDKFYNLCKILNAKPMPRILSIRGRALKNYDLLVHDKDKGIEDNVLKNPNMVSMCTAGVTNLSISANGKVNLCAALEDSDYVIGNIEKIDNLYDKLEKIHKACIVDEVDMCKDCIVRYFCSSSCHAINYHIYRNESLRAQRCKKNKKELLKYVWNIGS